MYPYLGATALFGMIWIVIWYLRPDLRRALWFGSLMYGPLGLAEPIYRHAYWNPNVIALWNGFDIESVVWSFIVGGIAAVLYEAVWRRVLVKSNKYMPHFLAIILLVAGFGVVGAVAALHSFSLMHVSFALAVPIVVALWIIRPDLMAVSLKTAALFTVIYSIILLASDYFSHGFLNQWNPAGNWGIFFMKVPLEEYICAFLLSVWGSMLYPIAAGLKVGGKKGSR